MGCRGDMSATEDPMFATFATAITAITAPDAGQAGQADVSLAFMGMPELLVVLAIVVVLFGATKLPQLGKGVGEAIGNFKKAQRDAMNEEKRAEEARDEIDATPKLSDKSDSVDTKFEEASQRNPA